MNTFLRACALFLGLLVFSKTCLFGQEKVKDYVKGNAIEVKHINIEEENFDDLEGLGEAIGDTRIVALGEQMHGDGTTFEAKGRIIKYLHEKKGFNVLVFESDFYGLTYGFEKARENKDSLPSFIFKNLISIWSHCESASPLLYDYLIQTQTTSSPLILAGMDCQMQTEFTFQHIEKDVIKVLSKISITKQDTLLAKNVIDNISTIYFTKQEANLSGCENGLNSLKSLLKGKSLQELNEEEINLLKNLQASFESMFLYLNDLKNNTYTYLQREGHIYRDRQMFNNLMWLLKYKYPNEKFIVWAHNAHISKSIYDFEDTEEVTIMTGEFLGNPKINPFSYYSIGFTSYSAKPVWVTSPERTEYAEKPASNSFETWINKDWNYAFLDWKTWNQNPSSNQAFSMKGSLSSTQHRNYVYQWNKAFDGVFFIRNIEGCEKVSFDDVVN